MTSWPPEGLPRAPHTGHPAKAALRAHLREKRSLRLESPEQTARRTARALEVSQHHDLVACYASVPGEPDTWGLIDGLHAAGITVLLPLLGRTSEGVARREPDWATYAGREKLQPGFRGIQEPTTQPLGPLAIVPASLIWVSGLAGTASGARLGTGGGWYDRALQWTCPDNLIGMLLFDDEVLPEVPTDAWDHPVDVIVTEERVISCWHE